MAAETASLCWTLLFVRVFVFVSAEEKTIITAESGQDVTLTCRAAPNYNNKKIVVVKWGRTDLENEHVLLYRDGHFAPALQHPSFGNRVDLQDRQMKDGDVSLILKDVNTADEGTYECRVLMEGERSWKHTIIYLGVAPPDQPEGNTEAERKEDGSVGLLIGLLIGLSLCLSGFWVVRAVNFVTYRKKQPYSEISEDQSCLRNSEENPQKTKLI